MLFIPRKFSVLHRCCERQIFQPNQILNQARTGLKFSGLIGEIYCVLIVVSFSHGVRLLKHCKTGEEYTVFIP